MQQCKLVVVARLIISSGEEEGGIRGMDHISLVGWDLVVRTTSHVSVRPGRPCCICPMHVKCSSAAQSKDTCTYICIISSMRIDGHIYIYTRLF